MSLSEYVHMSASTHSDQRIWIFWSLMWVLGSDLRFSARAALPPNPLAISPAFWESHFMGRCLVYWVWDLCLLRGWERIEHLIHGPICIVLSVGGASFSPKQSSGSKWERRKVSYPKHVNTYQQRRVFGTESVGPKTAFSSAFFHHAIMIFHFGENSVFFS